MGINEYENVSGGWVGVKVKDDSRRTGFRGQSVAPRQRVSLDEDERKATANAPRNDEDNPFLKQLRLIAKDQDGTNRRPTGDGEPQPPMEPEPEPSPEPAETPTEEKPEDQMTQAEIDAHNAKAAAARAIPAKQAPDPPPKTAEKPNERVGTPEAVAAAGEKPEGKRAAGEQVGTPSALKK